MKVGVIAAIVALLVSATSATAAFVVTSKNIKNGTIQMVDISPKAKAALKGNRGLRGRAGAQGAQGAPGTPGTPGPPGLTNADQWYFLRDLKDPATWLPIVTGIWPEVIPSMTRVLSLHLDKGNYVITTQVIAQNHSGQGFVVCVMGNSSLGYSVVQGAVGSVTGFAAMQTMTAQDVFKLAEPADLALSCFNAPAGENPVGSPGVGYGAVIAAKVDTATLTRVE